MAITKIPTELIDTTSHMDFLDGEKLRLGTSNDLHLYHDGTHSYLASSTGSLYARTGNTFQIENQSGSEDLDAKGDQTTVTESVGDPLYQTVAYSKKEWNVYIIKALQELKAENESLKARIEALEG